jgi:hypothetical protein
MIQLLPTSLLASLAPCFRSADDLAGFFLGQRLSMTLAINDARNHPCGG